MVGIETLSAEILVKRFLSAFLLLSGLLVAGGASASITNQNISGSTAVVFAGQPFIGSNGIAAFIFKTGPTTRTIDSISLALWMFSAVQSVNFTIQLRSVVAGQPSTILASANVSGSANPGSPAAVNTYNAGLLGAIATTSLNPNTQYAIDVTNSSTQVYLGNDSATYTTTDGWLYVSSLVSTNGGTSYNAAGADYVVAISATAAPAPTPTPTPASIPSLSEWTQLLLGLMVMMLIGWHFHRERSYL